MKRIIQHHEDERSCTSIIELSDKKFISITVSGYSYMSLPDLKQSISCTRELTNDSGAFIYVDPSDSMGVHDDAKFYLFDEKNKADAAHIKALAVLEAKLHVRLIMNPIAKLKKHPFPIKFCRSKEEGMKWLQEIAGKS